MPSCNLQLPIKLSIKHTIFFSVKKIISAFLMRCVYLCVASIAGQNFRTPCLGKICAFFSGGYVVFCWRENLGRLIYKITSAACDESTEASLTICKCLPTTLNPLSLISYPLNWLW